ncbi:MAG TPA: hypothetical protein VGR48_07370 [Terriglobales bacterium]|nr:hypothetical protein [Terriglobales bacterium]
MAGTNLNSVQLGSFLAALGLLLGAFLLPWLPIHSLLHDKLRILPTFRRVAQRRTCAILLVGLIAFAGDALVSWRRPPLPVVPDEFSYLLAADTFASGRLTNPTPARYQHFETPEVLVRPTYQSKYPPGQGLFLALGQLAGKPLAGVWLSSALACAALCWMLQAWVGETWALYGALLAACQLAFFGHWAQSYWGGMVAALGGALLYGAVRRIADNTRGRARVRDALWLALGLVILANTRPFEGLLSAVPAGIALLAWLLANRGGLLQFSRQVLLPAAALLLLGALLMLTYNQRVTGSAWQLPYQVYERQYDAVPGFIFQPLRPWPQLQDAAMTASAVDTLAAWRWAHGFYRLVFISSKVFGLWQFAFGAALSLPFVMLVWAERWPRTVQILQVIVFAAVQGMAVARFLFWPSPSPVWILLLLLALLGQAVLLVRFFPAFWERIALLALGLVALGLALETWRFHSHYIAPVVPLAFVLLVQALRRSCAWTRGTRAPGKVLALGLPVLALAIAAAGSVGRPGRLERWAQQRANMETRLASLPGRQLIIVHYEPQHDFYEEWVENRADLQRAQVIWARERSPQENCLLIASYPGRAVWLFDVDRGHLEKYNPDCAGGAKTQPSAPVLELLPEH